MTPKSHEVALLQYTSGSTGNPKGVPLTHGNLLTNIWAIGKGFGAGDGDVMVSWLPLYHDMGLIGMCLVSFVHGLPLVLMAPDEFLSRPVRWLRAFSRYRGTMTAAPNFAYAICAKKIEDADLEGVDLSTWRLALNGAEPVVPSTVRAFTERFQVHGFREAAMFPAYGLAEGHSGRELYSLEPRNEGFVSRPKSSGRDRRGNTWSGRGEFLWSPGGRCGSSHCRRIGPAPRRSSGPPGVAGVIR